jgi:hypothetical protein
VYVGDLANVGGTLFNLNGSAKVSPNLTAGFHIQVGLDRGARFHQVTENDDDGGNAGDATMVLTLANWYLDHKTLGRVTVGRINTATAGITGIDLAGINVAAGINVGYWQRSFTAIGSGVNWADLLGGGTVSGSTLSRANGISYTSPTVGGFSVAAAWGEDDIWDASIRYAGEFSGFRLAAGFGYASNINGLGELTKDNPGVNGPEPGLWKGSASILHVASGLFVNGAYVRQDNDLAGRDDTTLWYVAAGIAKNWTGLGNTVLYGEYARVEDGVQSTTNSVAGGSKNAFGIALDSEATVWGFGVVQHIDAAAMELFLSYRNYSGDVNGVDAEDFQAVMGGARIKF